jgi:hypothetical protein
MRIRCSRFASVLVVLVAIAPLGCDDDGVTDSILPGDLLQGPAVVEPVPERSGYSVGETVAVDIVVGNAEDLSAVAFHFRFDAGVLRFQPPAEEGPFMGSDGTDTVFLAVESGQGGELVVGLSRMNNSSGLTGDGTLATFRFLAIAPGPCDFRFTGASLKDPQGMTLPATFRTAQVSIAP